MHTALARLARRLRHRPIPDAPPPTRPGPPSGWVIRQPRPGKVHVLPTDDLIAHEASDGCLCRPDETHHAQDAQRAQVVIVKHRQIEAQG